MTISDRVSSTDIGSAVNPRSFHTQLVSRSEKLSAAKALPKKPARRNADLDR